MKNIFDRLGPVTRIFLILIIVGPIAWFGYKGGWFNKSKTTTNSEQSEKLSSDDKDKVIKVCVVTWGGYAGGQYFNEGFKASKESRFFKEYGILVEFKLIDDFNASREAFKSGDVDLIWQTADAFPTEAQGMKDLDPKIIFQSDWSRGGDALVARRGINNVSDLKGKKIAVAPMTPSHTFLLNLLNSSGLKHTDVQIIEVANAMDAADLFKKQKVDAAVVWSPDDQACVEAIEGSKIVVNTKTAKNIIADVFIAKKEYIESHRTQLLSLIEGWLKGSAELNANASNKEHAAEILAEGLSQPKDFCLGAINNARLCTYGDNMNFFNLSGKYDGVTGEDLYSNMTTMYTDAGVIKGSVPAWRIISDASLIKDITKLTSVDDAAEGVESFAPSSKKDEVIESISSKKVSISFSTGKSELDENAKYIIDKEFANIAKGFSGAKIRVEGNTDNTGNESSNKTLSRKRAQAVADYLISNYNFDKNRIVVLGNGSDKPIADNNTDGGRSQNRRTDFELIAQ